MAGSFIRWCGLSLCVAAATTLALNVFVSPHLPQGTFATVAASPAYFLRQCIASAVALLLIFGVMGIQVGRIGRAGTFGAFAFVLALTGQVLLFAIEYGQAFQVHDYALNAPAMLDAAIADPRRPLTIGALIAVATFFVGWMLLAISLLASRQVTRLGPALIVIGLPLMFATKGFGVWGGIVTSAVTGAGWFLIGFEMTQRRNVA